MKKNLFLVFICSLMLSSCSFSEKRTPNESVLKINKIVDNAMSYKGVTYKFGGTTKKGMDCSGLVYVVFDQAEVQLPRSSRNMAKKGKEISLKEAKKGDLLFFKAGNVKDINHVGLIISNTKGEIRFVHSTTSRGVIVSSLSEKYWEKAFVKATKVL